MRKVLFLTLALSLMLVGSAFAADAAASLTPKIGVVDMQAVATQSEPAKAAKEKMEKQKELIFSLMPMEKKQINK